MENKPKIKDFMREKSSFFRYLKEEELQMLQDHARNRKFSNETILEEERWTPRVYLLYRGYVAVLPQSEEEVKWYLRPGMVLDTGIFMPEKRDLVTKTISDIEFFSWDREAFEKIFVQYPHLRQQFQTRVKLFSHQQQRPVSLQTPRPVFPAFHHRLQANVTVYRLPSAQYLASL